MTAIAHHYLFYDIVWTFDQMRVEKLSSLFDDLCCFNVAPLAMRAFLTSNAHVLPYSVLGTLMLPCINIVVSSHLRPAVLSGAGAAGAKELQAGYWTEAGAVNYGRGLRCIRKVRSTSHYTPFHEPLSW